MAIGSQRQSSRRGAAEQAEPEGQRTKKRRGPSQEEPDGQGNDATEDDAPGSANSDDPTRLANYYNKEAAAAREKLKISGPELDSLVRTVMRHVLFKQHQLPGVPISRTELTDLMAKATKQRVSTFVILTAQAKFVQTFGLHMKEVVRRTKASATQGVEGQKSYVMRTLLPAPLRREFLADAREGTPRALLLLLLTLVKLNSEKITDDELWRLLEEVGVPREGQHPKFGSTKDLLQTFVKQRYLVETRIQGPEGEQRQYEWGENAADEFQGNTIEKWVKELFGREQDVAA